MAAQAEILKSRVKRLIVRDNGIIAVEIFGRKQESIMDLSGNGSCGISGKNYGINGNCGADIRSAIAAKGAEISGVFEDNVLKLKNPVEPITRRASVRTGFKLVVLPCHYPNSYKPLISHHL